MSECVLLRAWGETVDGRKEGEANVWAVCTLEKVFVDEPTRCRG